MNRFASGVAWFSALPLVVATYVSHLERTARLPAWLTPDVISNWTSSRTMAGVPLEFVIALWCVAAARRRASDALQSANFLSFWSGIVVLALCVGLLYLVGPSCVPIAVASMGALLVVIDSGIQMHRLPEPSTGDVRAAIRHDWIVLRRPQRLAGLSVAAALALFAAQYLAAAGASATVADRDAQLARWYEAEPRLAVADLVAPGKIRVVAFTDYECPACSIQIPALEKIVARYRMGGYQEVEWALRDFPLNADCNPSVATRMHPLACRAAVAVRVADRYLAPPGSQAFRERLQRRHGRLAEEDIVRELEAVHLIGKFEDTFDEELKAVREDARLGGMLGITSTPTVFVDGRVLRDAQPKILAAILSHLGQKTGIASHLMGNH